MNNASVSEKQNVKDLKRKLHGVIINDNSQRKLSKKVMVDLPAIKNDAKLNKSKNAVNSTNKKRKNNKLLIEKLVEVIYMLA